MKPLLIILSVFLLSFETDHSTDRLGVKGPLVFNNTSFALSWTDKPNEHYYIQEYLPAGEKTATYHQMMTIHLFDMDITAEEAVAQKVKELNERKKSDAVCQYAAIKGPDGKEYIVDFLLSESRDGNMSIVEFNIYRYLIVNTGKGKALLVYAYTKRSYGNKIDAFLKALAGNRKEDINQMAKAKIPAINLKGK